MPSKRVAPKKLRVPEWYVSSFMMDRALEDVPSPFNIFQHMIIHPDGELEHSHIRPKPPGAHVTLRAEMDLLAALSTCPDVSVGGTTGATVTVLTLS